MLSNTDFADLLKSGDAGLTKDGKGRFGLEQVKTWDKQNNAQGKKKPSSFGKTPTRGGDGDESNVPKADKYRDRAFERRKDVVTSEEAALEAVVSKLDAEQTKFLGGDVEHTHLVKGLDYALLRKIREQEKEQVENEDDVPEHSSKNILDYKINKNQNQYINIPQSSKDGREGRDGKEGREVRGELRGKDGFKDLRTSSAWGEGLKNIMLNPTVVNTIANNSKTIAENISRMAFDFDLSEEGDQDLPTTIKRSKKEFENQDETSLISCLLSKALGAKLSIIFGKSDKHQTERQLKRKRKEDSTTDNKNNTYNSTSKTNGNSGSNNKKIIPKGEVEDIFADVGKYVPVGALDDKDEKEILKNIEERSKEHSKEHALKIKEELEDGEINEDFENNGNVKRIGNKMDVEGKSSSAKGLFSNLLPSFPTSIKLAADSTNNNTNNNSNNNGNNNNNNSSSSSSSSSSNKNINIACTFDDDDDDEEDGIEKAMNINTQKSSAKKLKTEESGQSIEENGGKVGKGIFSTEDRGGGDRGEDESRNISDTSDDLMAPIRAILAAQRTKEGVESERSEAAAGKGVPAPPAFTSLALGADGRVRVHRDVFGVVGSSGTAGGRVGDAMGHGAYDDYGGDNETYDSDQEDENEGKEYKKGGNLSAIVDEEIRKEKVWEKGGKGDKGDRERGDRGDGKSKEGGGGGGGGGYKEKKDHKNKNKEKERETEGDSSGNWRHSNSSNSNSNSNDKSGCGGEKQSAIRPSKEGSNRAARRAGKS